MSLTDEQREEISGCAECMAAVCSVCGHEPCPACVDDCDDSVCIEWSGDSGKKSHVCIFARCAKHAARCSDCGTRPIEAWSPYARYCYYCGSKGAVDVSAAWLDAIEGIEKELVLLAVYHRDGDLTPRALQWLQARKETARKLAEELARAALEQSPAFEGNEFLTAGEEREPAGLRNALERELGGPVAFVETSWDRKGGRQ